jgi:hypothetical protein
LENLKQKAKAIRKDLDKITRTIGSTETVVINELFDNLQGLFQEALEELEEKNREYAKLVAKQAEEYALKQEEQKQEIDKLKSILVTYGRITLDFDKEQKEQKRKLQQIVKDFPKVPLGLAYVSQLPWYKKVGEWLTKLEEFSEG